MPTPQTGRQETVPTLTVTGLLSFAQARHSDIANAELQDTRALLALNLHRETAKMLCIR